METDRLSMVNFIHSQTNIIIYPWKAKIGMCISRVLRPKEHFFQKVMTNSESPSNSLSFPIQASLFCADWWRKKFLVTKRTSWAIPHPLNSSIVVQYSFQLIFQLHKGFGRKVTVYSDRARNSLSPCIFTCPLTCLYGRKNLSAMKTMSTDKCQKSAVFMRCEACCGILWPFKKSYSRKSEYRFW